MEEVAFEEYVNTVKSHGHDYAAQAEVFNGFGYLKVTSNVKVCT